MVWFAPLIAAAASQIMKKPEAIEPIQAHGGVIGRRKDNGGGAIMGALGDIGMNAVSGSGGGSASGSAGASSAIAGSNPSGPQSMETASALSRRKENLLNLDTIDKGMSIAKNNPEFQEYLPILDDAKKKARGY